MTFTKHDADKRRYSLLPWGAINQRRTWRDNGDGSSSHVKGEGK